MPAATVSVAAIVMLMTAIIIAVMPNVSVVAAAERKNTRKDRKDAAGFENSGFGSWRGFHISSDPGESGFRRGRLPSYSAQTPQKTDFQPPAAGPDSSMNWRILLCFLFLGASCARAAEKPPNILFILIDDLGWMDLSCQGNPNLHTPNIDRFAKQGMRFTDAYAAAPVCSPTRAAIMTGFSPARLHLTNHLPHQERFTPENSNLLPAEMTNQLPLENITIAERLRDDAGYATAFIGKWHLYSGKKSEFAPQHQGFDINIGGCANGGPPTFFDPYRIDFLEDRKKGEYLPDRLADEAISFMRDQTEAAKPFYVALFNYTVHWPMEAPENLVEKYKNRPLKGYRDHRYAAMIEAMDSAIGRVLEELDQLEIADETLVVFTSDNGPFGGVGDARPLRADKGHLYEGGIRVPLIVRWPGIVDPGTVSAVPVISTDFYPTLLDAAGLEPLESYPGDGENLQQLLAGEGKLKRDAIFWHYPNFAWHRGNRLGSAIRMGDFKLLNFFDDDSVELYNLKDDLGEKKNLADEQPELAARMKTRLADWRESSGAKSPRPRG
ncbi:MAG: arylsulfatase A [Verrucomicrobiales bacterium]